MQKVLSAALLLGAALCADARAAEVTVLQNGSSPTPAYAGCAGTWISDEPYERDRDSSQGKVLRSGGKRHVLVRFDLAPIPKEHVVHRAILRLSDLGYPRKQDGQWVSNLVCYRLAREWSPDGTWLKHTKTNLKENDAGDWASPGGDMDTETDFGREPKGLIATDVIAGGFGGHVHQFDVTEVVRLWHSGKLPNCGLLLKGGHCEVANNSWPVPASRPALIVDHGAQGGAPSGLELRPAAPEKIELDPVADTPDTGGAKGDYGAVRVGQHAGCALRGGSTDTYVKSPDSLFPGPWGWMTMGRVGGAAGVEADALLYFDLSEIPRDASIKEAKLHLSLVSQTSNRATDCRYAASLLKLPDVPGWNAAEAGAACRKAAVPWPAGSPRMATSTKPVAVGKIATRRDKDRTIPDAIEFDLTGAVRAWVQGKVPNCGLVLDNRIEGGAYDFHSGRSWDPDLRPYLEIALAPAVAKKPEPVKVEPALPPGDYWVAPMREVHKRFKGKPGTLAQYGDSITITMAYLASYSWAGKIEPKNCPPEVKQEMDIVAKYSNLNLWREWKGPEWGNTGMMKSDWLLNNIDAWQKKMNPEVAVILFGTNDLGSICPPEYTENMAAAIRRMLADGTVPMLTTAPPASGRPIAREYWLAGVSIARGLKIPVIDYYAEILRRRPDDWDGRMEKFKGYKDVYAVPTLISGDGTHPSNPKEYANDFGEEGLSSNGYNLRDYMTLRKYYEVISKVLQP